MALMDYENEWKTKLISPYIYPLKKKGMQGRKEGEGKKGRNKEKKEKEKGGEMRGKKER